MRATFAENVKRRRQRLGWSQEKLAFEADLHRVYMNRLEALGRNVTLDMVERLAHALGVDPVELLLQPRQPAPPSPDQAKS
ncbi:helix-turn-helix domain-containing protein [Chenggangzhangella methanolivorans]|uniref:Helix-turn-helix domain-containing protein n=1 Tax=Chenggangzhangella methanolivorans TaxID=1437009 RepID=A0A9E6UNY8_9HYPH|nr:helix-turn-helix domain-containing protein [Chenggangzhangella methanolivorans]